MPRRLLLRLPSRMARFATWERSPTANTRLLKDRCGSRVICAEGLNLFGVSVVKKTAPELLNDLDDFDSIRATPIPRPIKQSGVNPKAIFDAPTSAMEGQGTDITNGREKGKRATKGLC